MAATTRRTLSFLQLSSRMKSPQLLLATIAISSSSWSRIPLFVESFPINTIHQNKHQRTAFGLIHQHRSVHLPARNSKPIVASSSLSDDSSGEASSHYESVTGPIYEMGDGVPTVKLFTKQGCTLCDKVKDVLESVREDQPHSLYAVDITDDDKQEWFAKYKYDIPVLRINDNYWTKHRLSAEDAITGIEEARTGDFAMRRGEPNASELEHN